MREGEGAGAGAGEGGVRVRVRFRVRVRVHLLGNRQGASTEAASNHAIERSAGGTTEAKGGKCTRAQYRYEDC